MATALTLPAPGAGSPRPADAPPPPHAPRPARRPVPPMVWGTMVPGALLLAFVAFLVLGSSVQAHREQSVLRSRLAGQLAQAVAPVAGVIPAGTPVAEVDVESIGLQQVVVYGSSAEQTAVGPGLKPDSALPGQAGLSVLVGRRATFGAPFRHLDRIDIGDTIRVTTGQGVFRYRVDVRRTTDSVPSRMTQAPARLTLVTSDPVLTPNRELLVSAALVGQPLARTTTPWSTAADAPGAGDRDGAVALLLWAQLLLLVVVAATWAALRFPRRTVWVGAVPVLVAVLWHVFDHLAALLPNTL